MVSSYTPNKNLEKPGNGDYVDTWNIPVNSDMSVIDAALGSVTSLNATSGSANLSVSNYQNMALNITGAMTANVTYTIPSGVGGSWIVRNATTDSSGGPWYVTIASAGGGSNVTVLRGKAAMIWSDGTNIRDVNENVPTIGTVTSVNVSGGSTGLTTSGGPITTSGTITIAGVLGVANGGTNVTSFGTGVGTALTANVTGSGGFVLAQGPTVSNATIVTPTIDTPVINFAKLNLPTFTSGTAGVPSGNLIYTVTFPTADTTLIGANNTVTVTNKRITPRVSAANSVSSPLAWNSDNYDEYQIKALANDLTISVDSGTPTVGQKIIFSITDNGTARALTWTTGSSKAFRAAGVTPPTTTVANKVTYVGFIYNDSAARWDCVASAQES